MASLDAGSSRQELLYLFSQYGELRDVADDPLGRPNCCLVEFYDTRHAGGRTACSTPTWLAGHACLCWRSCPALPSRAPGTTIHQALTTTLLFPPTCAPAAAALQGISQAPDMASRLVVMDPSAAAVLPQAGPGAPSAAAAQLSTSLSHDYLAAMPSGGQPGSQYGGGMRNVGSSPPCSMAAAPTAAAVS